MSHRMIGESISEAIDWTQDRLLSTRPIAESVLFSLLADRKVVEREAGFVLLEDDDEELHRRRNKVRFRFHSKRTGRQMRTHMHNVPLQRGNNAIQFGGLDADDNSEA